MMGDQEESADIFAIPDFWKPSQWLHHPIRDINDNNPFFSLKVPDKPKQNPPERGGAHDVDKDGFFKLPPLLGGSKQIQTVQETIPELGIDTSVDGSSATDDDPWLLYDFTVTKAPEFRTWEAFDRSEESDESEGRGPSATFITEAGPAAFDALSQGLSKAPASSGREVLGNAGYCVCLLALAMGRSSILFSWNSEQKTFVRAMAQIKTSGFSDEALAGVNKMCLECANSIKALQLFVNRTYSTSPTPSKIALADVVDKLLLAIQSEMGIRGQRVRSVLQLQSIVKPIRSTLVYFKDLVARLARAKTDEEVLSLLFQETQSAEYRDGLIRNVVCEVLRMVSKPWTTFVEEWIGLKDEEGITLTKDGPGKSFVKVANKMWIDDQGFELEEPQFFLDGDKMPSFMPEDTAQAIFETGRNIRFIKENHPEHPLSDGKLIAACAPPGLHWEFDWEAITQLEERAKEYEGTVSRALQDALRDKTSPGNLSDSPNTSRDYGLQFFGRDEGQITENFLASMAIFDQPLRAPVAEDGLSSILRERLFETKAKPQEVEEFNPHWSLLPPLSFGPVVTAQARLVNRECVKLLFSAHNLRVHLDLQKQYHLLGNGIFCSDLSHALFDPELDTAERHAGVALTGGSMGLRLNGRDNWPPASSELRLALMGVLSDSYQPPSRSGKRTPGPLASPDYGSELPGDLSFSVRNLSPEEIERCIDPDALEALDFLRLSYKPPPPLRPILTPLILFKYDRIFQLLLRTLRMLYVANQLFRDVSVLPQSDSPTSDGAILRFRIEAHHFIAQIASHFFTTGIAGPWRRFEEWLDGVEADVLRSSREESDAGERRMHRPDRLRERHEQVLDDIMLALLLRKRQGPVLKLLEGIFGVILRFAKLIRLLALDRQIEADGDRPEHLYAKFRQKVEVFIAVCKGLTEKSNYGSRNDRVDGEGRTGGGRGGFDGGMEQFLLNLDMSGYYSRKQSS